MKKLITRIRAFSKQPGWSPHALAVAAGISPWTLRDMHQPDWNPTKKTLEACERFINTHQKELKNGKTKKA